MPSKPRQPVTLSAVARQAGVSAATVSYVLNGVQLDRIPEPTQARVRDAARALGYVPNASARSLRMGRSELVIIHLPGGTAMLQRASLGISQLNVRLREAGYTLLIHNDDSLSSANAAQHWVSLRPAALVTDVGFLDADSVALLHQVGTLVLELTHRRASTAPVPRVMLDDSALGDVAVAHLLERGCRDIAMLIPQHPRALMRARIRLAGVKRALRAAKNNHARLKLVQAGNTPADAARIAELWRKQRPEGVFGFDDEHSGMLLAALQDVGLRVPEQLALVGADDQPLCEMLRPRLTSVALDLVSMRERFVGPILSAIHREWTHGTRGEPWDAVLKPRDT